MRSIAITSGKGGVGKTNISANLAISLSRQRQRVVVFDVDIGLANLDVVLGCKAEGTLQEVISGDKLLKEVMHAGPAGIRFVPGGSGIETLFTLTESQRDRFLGELAALESDTDFLIFDTGAGIDGNVMTFLGAADEVFIVVTPDPASLTDGYATAKALFTQKPDAQVNLILNMVANEAEAKLVHAHLNSVAQRFLSANMNFGGFVRMDPAATAYIRKRVPFTIGDPHLPASTDIAKVALSILGHQVDHLKGSLVDRLKNAFFARKAA
jgi:flagellar biosynthesis protein FlhG